MINFMIFILLAGVGFYFIREDVLKKKSDKKQQERIKVEAETIKEQTPVEVIKPVSGPCDDKRNGKYNPSWDRTTCNKNGYFFCPISNRCIPSSVNVNSCGKPPHLM